MIKLENWNTLTTPRKMMLAAFVMQFCSLFMLVSGGGDGFGTHIWNTPSIGTNGITVSIRDAGETGLHARPLAIVILPALFLMFATKFYEQAWCKKFGYLVSLGIMLFATTRGELFMTLGGFLNVGAFFLACTAAFMQRGAKEANKATGQGSGQGVQATGTQGIPTEEPHIAVESSKTPVAKKSASASSKSKGRS